MIHGILFLCILTEDRISFFDCNQGIHSPVGTYLGCFQLSFTITNWCNPSAFILIFFTLSGNRERESICSIYL